MKIEIKKNSVDVKLNHGQLALFINDELVMKDRKIEIMNKINKIIDTWF